MILQTMIADDLRHRKVNVNHPPIRHRVEPLCQTITATTFELEHGYYDIFVGDRLFPCRFSSWFCFLSSRAFVYPCPEKRVGDREDYGSDKDADEAEG